MIVKHEDVPLKTADDVVIVRQRARALALEVGFRLVDQTKIVTAASELARNTIDHGGGGTAALSIVRETARLGLRLVFEDHGPGIPDVTVALTDGYSTRGGLGLGLGGARRLASEFEITSVPGVGTTVSITRWQ